jgi:hypothetical protein
MFNTTGRATTSVTDKQQMAVRFGLAVLVCGEEIVPAQLVVFVCQDQKKWSSLACPDIFFFCRAFRSQQAILRCGQCTKCPSTPPRPNQSDHRITRLEETFLGQVPLVS